MNRSIFQIWKLKQISTNMNNKQINKFTIIKFMEVGRYEIYPDLIVKSNFVKKFRDHWNLKFNILGSSESFSNIYLTCNTNENEANTSEFIGKIFTNRRGICNQYVNYNYPVITKYKTDRFIFKLDGEEFITTSKRINQLLTESDKIGFIENKLNNGFEIFSLCMKQTNHFKNCYQTLIINHSDDAKAIIEIFFNVKGFK